MKAFGILVISIMLVHSCIFAQHSELGIIGGSSYYYGELNPGTAILNQLNPFVGIYYRKNLNKAHRYALRYGVNFGKIGASDSYYDGELNVHRHLSFSANLLEGYGLLELNFFPYEVDAHNAYTSSPYVFIGLSSFYTNPEVTGMDTALFDGEKSVFSFGIPFGFGYKFNVGRNFGMSLEWSVRKTFTDRIDGLAKTYSNDYQLSNTGNKDWYSYVGLTLNFKFLQDSDRCPSP